MYALVTVWAPRRANSASLDSLGRSLGRFTHEIPTKTFFEELPPEISTHDDLARYRKVLERDFAARGWEVRELLFQTKSELAHILEEAAAEQRRRATRWNQTVAATFD